MFVKKFEAHSMEEALAQIKRELGPNALILSTQNKRGSLFQKHRVEVTAALEKKKKEETEAGFDELEIQRVFPHRREKLQAAAPKKTPLNKYAEVSDSEPAPEKKALVPSRQAERFENGFLELGFSSDASKEFARRLVFDYSRKDLVHASFLQRARVRLVAGGLSTLGPDALGGSESWVAIGMPGSGKTSCLVKLALYLRSQKRSLTLVSVDARKIAGRSEMMSYARLLKVPFAPEPTQVGSGKLQLIDGPSLSFHREEEGQELQALCSRRSTLLVLDASQRLSELCRIAEHARRFNPVAVTFTRIDVVSQLGVLYDVLKATKLPLLGLSLSRAFTTPFKFFEPGELASFLLNPR